MRKYIGNPLSKGKAIAPAFRLSAAPKPPPRESKTLFATEEALRLTEACRSVDQFLQATKQRIAEAVGTEESEIFAGQQMLLKDPSLLSDIQKNIEQGLSAEEALEQTLQVYHLRFRAMQNPRFREKSYDLMDVWNHVLAHLVTGSGIPPEVLTEPVVLVGEELLPSQLAHFEWSFVRGIVTSKGGAASHTAILAQSLEIPYLSNVSEQQEIIAQELLVVDSTLGVVYVNPEESIVQSYRVEGSTATASPAPNIASRTQCGQPIALLSNVNLLSDLADTNKAHAEGVGLLRTEILYASRPSFPSEEDQEKLYRSMIQQMAPLPVTFRVFDLGGDKHMASFPATPFSLSPMGWRGLRIHLDRQDILKSQLRAILRASQAGPARILFPMLSSMEELQRLQSQIAEAQKDLQPQGHHTHSDVAYGLMVETPAAALMLNELAPHFDFVSIGTNDLLQFLMAAERGNPHVEHLLQPAQPALLRVLHSIATASASRGYSVSICGEIAAQPLYLPLLLGLGFRELSVPPKQIPRLRKKLTTFNLDDAKQLAEKILLTPSSTDVLRLLQNFSNRA